MRRILILLPLLWLSACKDSPIEVEEKDPIQLIDLGTLPGHVNSVALGVNDHGHVVGHSWPAPYGSSAHSPFVWTPERGMWQLKDLGGGRGHATAINTRGQIVGMVSDSAGQYHAVLWENADAAPTKLGVSGGPSDINEKGEIAISTIERILLWTPVGVFDRTGSENFYKVYATALNDHSVIVGSVTPGSSGGSKYSIGHDAAIWTAEGMTRLPAYEATDINNKGEITGHRARHGDPAGYWNADGVWQELPGGPGSANAINEHSEFAGNTIGSHGVLVATAWRDGQALHLRGLLPDSLAISAAYDMSNGGHIVGSSRADPELGNPHAVLWILPPR